jgi:hypothetical protein
LTIIDPNTRNSQLRAAQQQRLRHVRCATDNMQPQYGGFEEGYE